MQKELEAIAARIKGYQKLSGAQIAEELEWCISQLARVAEIEADAYGLMMQARSDAMKNADLDLPPSKLKAVVEADTYLEMTLFRKAERLNAALVHAIDGLRSLLSNEKHLTRFTPQGR